MQTPYRINCSLKEYNEKVKNKTWEFPSYKECCAICKRSNCAQGNGFYKRVVVGMKEIISGLQIKRFICMKEKVTFSLLPDQLVPYRKNQLGLMTYVLSTWIRAKKDISVALDNICIEVSNLGVEIYDEICNIGDVQIHKFVDIFELARRKYVIWKKVNLTYKLETFIGLCSKDKYCYAEVLNNKYYNSNGGYQTNSQFLFGKASQFRQKRK